jgi:hypothetical protein
MCCCFAVSGDDGCTARASSPFVITAVVVVWFGCFCNVAPVGVASALDATTIPFVALLYIGRFLIGDERKSEDMGLLFSLFDCVSEREFCVVVS